MVVDSQGTDVAKERSVAGAHHRRRAQGRCFALLPALVFGLVLALPLPAFASAVELFGYGMRGGSMAGAVHTSASGHAAVYYNPAGLAEDTRPSFALGYQRGDFRLQVNGERFDTLEAPALIIGFGVPLPFGGILEDRIAIGLGFVLPQTSILIADTPVPSALTWSVLGNRAQTVSIQGAVGVRLLDSLSMGGGFIALSALRGSIAIAPNAAGQLSSSVSDELVADYSPVLGLRWRPLDRLALALVWRGESTATYTLPITADLGASFPVPVPVLEIQGTAQFDPASLALEVGVHPAEAWLVAAAVLHRRWSTYPTPIVYTAVPADYPAQPSPDFSDTWSLRVGAEWTRELGEWTLQPRAGLAWEPSPVPTLRDLHNHLDADRILLSLGLGIKRDIFSVQAAFQGHFLRERTAFRACVDTPGGPVFDSGQGGRPAPLTPNPGCGELRYGGALLFSGIEVGVEF